MSAFGVEDDVVEAFCVVEEEVVIGGAGDGADEGGEDGEIGFTIAVILIEFDQVFWACGWGGAVGFGGFGGAERVEGRFPYGLFFEEERGREEEAFGGCAIGLGV